MPDSDWFTRGRFGLFIHWGLYALPARHEWVMTNERMTAEHYDRYFQRFDPDLYDPHEWARSAKAAGMAYVVLTTKHHDGFCLWDSALTDFTAVNTPAGRDLVREFVDAIRAAGLKVGFYHSLIDWHHPDFPIDGLHPRRDDGDAAEQNAGRSIERYRDYLHGQVRELLTDYGKIDYLFFDFSYADAPNMPQWNAKGAEDWGSADLLATVRELQPEILVNDRLGIRGDFTTPEQYQPSAGAAAADDAQLWEACQTLNGSWGYDRDNLDDKPSDLLIRMLVDSVATGGNMLLNVGPTARGEFDPRARRVLADIGEWMRLHARSITGAGASIHTPPSGVRYTQRDDRLYAHVFVWPFKQLHLPGLAQRVAYAQLLNDASEIPLTETDPNAMPSPTQQAGQPAGTLTLELPVRKPEVAVPVIELFLTEHGS